MRRPTWETLKLFWSTAPWHIYMPLAETVWQAIGLFSWEPAARGDAHMLQPIGFKIASVVGHALSAAVAAWTLSRLTRTRWPALAGALVFALHPLQVESVAWTTGLKDVLCGLFACAAIGLYAEHAPPRPADAVAGRLLVGGVRLRGAGDAEQADGDGAAGHARRRRLGRPQDVRETAVRRPDPVSCARGGVCLHHLGGAGAIVGDESLVPLAPLGGGGHLRVLPA